MEDFELAILLTTAGAFVGAAFVKTLVSAAKGLGFVPEHGRGPLYAALLGSAILIGLALWDANIAAEGITAGEVFRGVLALLGLYSASVGIHETAVKIERVVTGTTNRTGPDS